MASTPVLIVGGGPIGLAVAAELAFWGVHNVLVEKSDGSITQPKMDLIGERTMEFVRRWGFADQVRACPYNPLQPQDNVWLQNLVGWEFGREPFPSPAEAAPPPQSPVKRERCPQDMFDPILRRWVEARPEASVRHRVEMISFRQDIDGITATLRDADGTEETIEALYLVGADGGASSIRQTLGIGMRGKPTLTHTTNVIFRCPNFWTLHDKKKAYRYIFIDETGAWATLVAIDGYDRFRFSIIGDETNRTLDNEQIRAAILRAMGRQFDFEILSVMPWVRRELVADRYADGRVFLAGDAVHLNSPTGAFGMNTGMQDAVDLGWKLAAVLQGWGGTSLLASYELERRPVALRNVAAATSNLVRMVSAKKLLTPAVFDQGPAGDAARVAFGAAYTEVMKREWFTLDVHLGYRYDESPLIISDGSPPPDDPPMVYTQTARPGGRAPHVWLAPGKSTLDLFSRNFVLLRFDRHIDASPLVGAATRVGLPLDVVDLDNKEAKEIYGAALTLVRPDGFVAWRGDLVPADAAGLLDRARGAG